HRRVCFGLRLTRFPLFGDGRLQKAGDVLLTADLYERIERGAFDFLVRASESLKQQQLGCVRRGKGLEFGNSRQPGLFFLVLQLLRQRCLVALELCGDVALLAKPSTGRQQSHERKHNGCAKRDCHHMQPTHLAHPPWQSAAPATPSLLWHRSENCATPWLMV